MKNLIMASPTSPIGGRSSLASSSVASTPTSRRISSPYVPSNSSKSEQSTPIKFDEINQPKEQENLNVQSPSKPLVPRPTTRNRQRNPLSTITKVPDLPETDGFQKVQRKRRSGGGGRETSGMVTHVRFAMCTQLFIHLF